MAPLLIERKGIIKLGLVISAMMVTLFISGYFIGYSTAENMHESRGAVVALTIPEGRSIPAAETSPSLPDVIEPGEHIDVDAPGSIVKQPESVAAAIVSTVEAGPAASAGGIYPQPATVRDEPQANDSQPPAHDEIQTQNESVGGPVEMDDDPLVSMLDNADEDTAKYSIQVGLFRDEENAERRVEDLMAQRLNAYRTSFTDKENSAMHNVRFGFYADYASVSTALQAYKAAMHGDGYIVRIKR